MQDCHNLRQFGSSKRGILLASLIKIGPKRIPSGLGNGYGYSSEFCDSQWEGKNEINKVVNQAVLLFIINFYMTNSSR